MLNNAKKQFNFYETPIHHAQYIFEDYKQSQILKVIDICCGLGSLIQPWYDKNHDITLVELNKDFIPILQNKFPKAKILNVDYLINEQTEDYDVYLCNPPFAIGNDRKAYISFFCKILMSMPQESTLYFICPKMFYMNQNKIKIEHHYKSALDLLEYIRENNDNPASYYFDKYSSIELNSNEFRFNKQLIKRLLLNKIIDSNFIDDDFMILPYFEFRYIGNIFDFKETKCNCGIFKINN